ncbi:MAG: sigma-E processing peptidase SpoIIGA [Firmicutes bacterium]|nr:sigma-E processing peptidase SpoIIGA [Bacillota bacterium]
MLQVYGDLTFLLSGLLDASILWTTARLTHRRLIPWRTAIAASIGACYDTVAILPSLSVLWQPSCKVALAAAMVLACFPFGSVRRYAVALGAFLLVSFVMGGAVVAVNGFAAGAAWAPGATGGKWWLQASAITLLSAWPLGSWLMLWITRWRRQRAFVAAQTGRLTLWISDRSVTWIALLDTGNHLTDPITHAPVALCDPLALKTLLGEETVAGLLESAAAQDRLARLGHDPLLASRLLLIPYRGIGTEKQWIAGIRVDGAQLESVQGRRMIDRLVLGIAPQPLGNDQYQVIIHPQCGKEA